MRANREEWIEEAYRKGVRRAELAIDKAIREGRDVPGILAHFNAVMLGWDFGRRGIILYRRLTESPVGLAADEAWEPFDHPRLVEASRERVRRLEAACSPQSAQPTPRIAEKAKQETPEEREAVREKMRALARKLAHPP